MTQTSRYLLFALTVHSTVFSETLSYKVQFDGIKEKPVIKNLESVCDTVQKRNFALPSVNLLRRRCQRDLAQIEKVMRAEGFYASETAFDLAPGKKVMVTFRIKPGLPFLLSRVRWMTPEGDAIESLSIADTRLVLGLRGRAEEILNAEEFLLNRLRERQYPFPEIVEAKVTADHDTHSIFVDYVIRTGPKTKFGESIVDGLTTIDSYTVLRYVPWYQTQPYDIRLLEKCRQQLLATGLFATVSVRPEPEMDIQGQLPIHISLKERKHRTVRTGVSYKTDEKFGGKISWEHRKQNAG